MEVCVRFDGEPGIGDPGRRELVRMMSRITSLRWIAALLLLLVLATGAMPSVSAQESDLGAASATPTSGNSDISIGDESTTVIGSEEATPTNTPPTGGQSSDDQVASDSTDTPTSTPDVGIGGDSGGDVSTGDGTPVSEETPTEAPTDEASPSPTDTPDDVVAAASVSVSAIVYLCSSSYAGGDPSSDANCSPASGVDVGAIAGEDMLGTKTTDGSGSVSFDAPEGSEVSLSELVDTVPTGYVPDGNGTVFVTAEDGATGSIVNIQVETAGRLQISNGQCPTSGQARSEFVVVGPLAIQSAGLGCAPRANTTLTLVGPGGTYSAVTDGQGNWIGTLPVGTYTVSNANASEEVEVESGYTTIVLVVDYVPGPKGTLTVQRFDCGQGAEGTTIEIGGGPSNDTCLPSDKSVSVSSIVEPGQAPLIFDLGEDGTTSVDVAAGDYVVSDDSTSASLDVPVTEGSSVTVTINSTILTGSVSAAMFWCDSSVSGSVNPGNLGNWSNGCGRVGSGMVISLLDANGDLVSTASTGSNGSLSFSSLTPGRYSLSTSSGCALFANGADARNGFELAAGDTIDIMAFGCEEPSGGSEGPIDPGPDPGTIGGETGGATEGGGSIGSSDGSGYGGPSFGSPGYHTRNLAANPLASVSTLPATGEGSNDLADQMMLILLGFAALSAGAALQLSPKRGKRNR
jgi:hypothetical protein